MEAIPTLHPRALLLVAVLVCVAWLVPRVRHRRSMSKLPLYGTEYGGHSQRVKAFRQRGVDMYNESYRKFRGSVYRLTTMDGEKILIPPEFLPQLRNRPDEELSNREALKRAFESDYTGVIRSEHAHFLPHVIRADLTRNLARINPSLCLEVERSVAAALPPTDDWTCYAVETKLAHVVATVSGHIFLGPELCHRPEYLDPAVNYTWQIFAAVRGLKQWRPWLRPLGQWFVPELQQAKANRARFQHFLAPVVHERRQRMDRGEPVPDDMLQWMMARAVKEGVSDEELAKLQLLLSMAAIHTTSTAVTNVLFDLVVNPEVIPELRQEIETATAEHGGVMTTQALFQMKLVDSVLKESSRMNPTGVGRFSRCVLKPMTLSDGTQLPAQSIVEVAYGAIASDPAVFPNPEVFDPYRFYRLRTDGDASAPPGKREQYQFVSVTSTDMGFGYGRHACPGRFFAANEIKLILARILLDYDIAMPEGVTGRYQSRIFGAGRILKPNAEIRFRRRR